MAVPKTMWAIALLAAPMGCLDATVFDTEPPVTGLTRHNLDRLEAKQPASPPFKFVAIGDVHDAYDELVEAVDAINARDDIEFVAVAGDVTNFGLEQEYEWTYEEFRRLDVPYFVAIGNHDALTNGKELYDAMYGPFEFAFVYGGISFIFFNSNTLEFPNTVPNREWLEEQHALSAGRRIVWVTHQDISKPDEPPDRDSVPLYRGLLDTYDVSLVVHGHLVDFELERFAEADRLQCSTFEVSFSYNVVTVGSEGLSYERCWEHECVDVPAPTAEQENDR